MKDFYVQYEIEDGYVGKSRPQYFTINTGDLYEDMDEDDIREVYRSAVTDDFQEKITACGVNEDKFVEWALEQVEQKQR